MKKFIGMMIIIFLLLPLHDTMAKEPVILISGQTMTLNVNKVPLRIILERIHRTGIQVKIDPGVNPLITADFSNADIQKGLLELVKGYNHAFVWKQNEMGVTELSEIIIFKPGQQSHAESLISSTNLEIEKNPETGDIYVKNKILIRFKSAVSNSRIKTILVKLGASIKLGNTELGVYEITLPGNTDMQKAMAILAKEKTVATIEPDYAYKSSSTVLYYTGTAMDTRDSLPEDTNGSFPVAVLDTGLMSNYLPDSLNHSSFNALSPENEISDIDGHGTQMALIASGQVHPIGAGSSNFSNPVISIRAFDDNGYTSNISLMRSIDFAVKKGARVLSLSWGSETDSQFLEEAMDYAKAKGVIVVAAAGNTPTGKPIYPAAYDSVISVSALNQDGKAWEKSNFGDFVDIAAPGFAKLPIGRDGNPGIYAGTSISTAFIAGKLAAYLREHPEADTGIDKGSPGRT